MTCITNKLKTLAVTLGAAALGRWFSLHHA
jgi:hypothetical protein